MSAFDWWNTGASVFTALGTVGAFAVGGAVLLRDRRATAEQRAEAAARAEMDRRRQASFVTGWGVSTDSEHYRPEQRSLVMRERPKIQYTIRNNSDGPVSNVVILIPSEQEDGPRGNLDVGFLPPKSDRSTKESINELVRLEFSVPRAVPFFFTDTQGIRWFRDGQGALFEWSDEIDGRLWGPLAIVEAEEAPRRLLDGTAGSADA